MLLARAGNVIAFGLELLCSIILAADTLAPGGGEGEKGSFDQCLGVGVTLRL